MYNIKNLLIIFLTFIYSTKIHLEFNNISDGLFNKFFLLIILFLTTLSDFRISLILMIIILELFINDGINSEYFQCKFYDDREP